MKKRKLNTLLNNLADLTFGDYILFQEYRQGEHDGVQYKANVTSPIYAIYLGCFIADQTVGCNYIRVLNDRHDGLIQYSKIEMHIEWMDFIDILGHWKNRPDWKKIIKAYRTQNTRKSMKEEDIDWERETIKDVRRKKLNELNSL